MKMTRINLIEIDEKGSLCSSEEYDFDVLPRIAERILLTKSTDDPKIYKVLEVHHTPGKIPIIYVMIDYLTVRNVLQNIAKTMK